MPIEWNQPASPAQPAAPTIAPPPVTPQQQFMLDDPNNPSSMGLGALPYYGGLEDTTSPKQDRDTSLTDVILGPKAKQFAKENADAIAATYDPKTSLPYDQTVGMLPSSGVEFSILGDLVKGATNMAGAALAAPGNLIEAMERKGYVVDPLGTTGLVRGSKRVADAVRAEVNELPTTESALVQGAGQLAALAVTGGAAGATAMGAGAGGTMQYEDAAAHEANPDQALLALFGGTAIGASDALPLMWGWKRLNQALGGKLDDFVKGNNYFQDMPDWVKREAMLGALTEGGQEVMQTVGENWLARDIANYDPERSLNENVTEAMLTGGLLGGGAGYVLGKVRAAKKQELQDEYLARAQGLAKEGGINALVSGAQFTPLQDYVFLNKERHDLREQLANRGRPGMDDMANLFSTDQSPGDLAAVRSVGTGQAPISITTPTGTPTRLSVEKQTPRLDELDWNRDTKFADFFNNTIADQRVHPEQITESGDSYSITQALRDTDVVYAEINPYADQLGMLDEKIKQQQVHLEKLKLAQPTAAVSIARKAVEKQISLKKKQQKILNDKTRMAQKIARDVGEYVKSLRTVFGDDTKFVVTDGSFTNQYGLFERTPDRKLAGAIYPVLNNIPLSDDGSVTGRAALMFLDLDQMVTKVYEDQKLRKDMLAAFKAAGADKKMLKAKRKEIRKMPWYQNNPARQLFATINHEVGHRLISNHLTNLLNSAKSGNEQDAGIFFAIMDEYEQWIKEAARSPIKFFSDTVAAASHLQSAAGAAGAKNQNLLEYFNASGLGGDAPSMEAARYMQYLYSFDEFFAERTARAIQSENSTLQSLLPETKFYNQVAESFKTYFSNLPDSVKGIYNSNWQDFLRSQGIVAKLEELKGAAPATLLDILKGNREAVGYTAEDYAGMKAAIDKWGWVQSTGQTLLQNAKDNPHVEPLQSYVRATTEWAAFVRNLTAPTNEIIKQVNKLGKGGAGKVSEVLFEEARSKKRFTAEELSKRMDETEGQAYAAIRTELDNVLKMMREITLKDAQTTLADNPEALAVRLKEITDEFDKMQRQGYFPFMRYGKYTIYAKAKEDMVYEGERVKKGETLTFQTFETEGERDRHLMELQKELKDSVTYSKGIMSDTEFAIQGMPRSMLISLRQAMKGEDATPEQLAILDKAIESTTPFQSFKKQWVRKKGIHGYSEDMLRSFANYMRMAAGHIARVQYAPQLFGEIQQMDADMQVMRQIGEPTQKRQQMRDWMGRHFSYIMNPTNEWTGLRGAISAAYLGLNFKSAALQLVQLPQVVYPYLAARYGDAAAVAELTKAPWTMRDYILNPRDFAPQQSKDAELAKLMQGSKIVDSQGKPLRLYHGTDMDFETFDIEMYGESTGAGDLGEGFYFTDNPATASDFATGESSGFNREGANVRPVYLNIKNPATNETLQLPEVAEAMELNDWQNDAGRRVLEKLGYDGIIYTHPNGEKEYVVFRPEQVINALKHPDGKPKSINSLPEKERLGMMLNQGLSEQWLDQSYATELALAASENNLDRGLALGSYLKNKTQRMWHNTTRLLMLPFHITEKANRYATAIAAYKLDFEERGDHIHAVQAAREANWSANFEYARWNRPEFARGKKSVALMFSSFWQNSLYFATKDAGATRYWLMMLYLAGVMGLPFAEDIEDLLSGVLTWSKEKLGYKDAYTDLDTEAREFLKEINLPSGTADYVLHGISQDSFGIGLLEELWGMPIPRFDMSASVGMGNIIPGTELLNQQLANRGRPGAGAELVAGAAEAAGGAAASLGLDLVNAAVSGNTDTWKEAEKLIPFMFARNLSKAGRLLTDGQEITRSGEPISEFDLDSPRDIAEIVGQGLGFTPRATALGWEEYMATKQLIRYYESQKRVLQQQLNLSFMQEDREARADMLKKIGEFNRNVPYPEFAIVDPGKGVEQYLERQAEAGILGINDKRYLRIKRQMETTFGTGPLVPKVDTENSLAGDPL